MIRRYCQIAPATQAVKFLKQKKVTEFVVVDSGEELLEAFSVGIILENGIV